MLATHFLDVLSTANFAPDSPVAHHHDALTRRAQHRSQRRIPLPSFGHASEFTVDGTANVLINRYTLLWGCPHSILSDNGLQACSKLSHAVRQLLGARKYVTSSYHPNDNGRVECEIHTMAQMLAMVINELQTTEINSSLTSIWVQQLGQRRHGFDSQ